MIAEIKFLFIVFAKRENRPFWKVKFSAEDFSSTSLDKVRGNKIIFDLFRAEKHRDQLLVLPPSLKMLVEVSQKTS